VTVDGWAWGIYPQRPGTRPGIAPLGERDAKANGLPNAFDFGS
jgi:hypothetical protein